MASTATSSTNNGMLSSDAILDNNDTETKLMPTSKIGDINAIVVGTTIITSDLDSKSAAHQSEGGQQNGTTGSNSLVQNPPHQRPPGQQPAAEEDPTVLVPQLASSDITYGDLQVTIKVMNAIASLNPTTKHHNSNDRKANEQQSSIDANKQDGIALYKQSNLRPFRKALSLCMDMHQRTMYNGMNEEEHYDNRKQERSLKRQKMSEKDLYRKHIETTALRKGRVDKLQAALHDYEDEERQKLQAMMIPDGHVDVALATTTISPLLLQQSAAGDEKSDAQEQQETSPATGTVVLPCLRSCYVCKIRYRELHFFYDQLCPTCAALNYEKRYQTVSCHPMRVAVVTGARVKIGYQTCLKLLRANCIVIATTRFPNAAIDTYRKESDFDGWKHLLFVYGLDLRDVIGIEIFTRYLKQRFDSAGGIDIIINNACQTIRRPCGYYQPAVLKEQTIWQTADETHKSLLSPCMEFEALRRKQVTQSSSTGRLQQQHSTLPLQEQNEVTNERIATVYNDDSGVINAMNSIVPVTTSMVSDDMGGSVVSSPFEVTGISHSAAMSQMIILPEDVGVNDEILPAGISDINGQQLDLRTSNSWLLKMEQISTPEFLECMYINAMAPFVLNSRLKPLMTHPNTNDRPDRYIINVSAMEGKFYRYKTECHPHTNMAKAALNMLTRTSAEDLAMTHRIYMNSVDTGWINDENPLEKASKIAKANMFQTPIDEIDAAARILDPIFTGIKNGRDGVKVYGKFLKDYKESEW